MVVDDTLAYLPAVEANGPLKVVKYIIKACKKWASIKDAHPKAIMRQAYYIGVP
jgi:hypothetical protein